MSTIAHRLGVDRAVGGDTLGAWFAGLDAAFAEMPSVRVYGLDLAHASRPRAVRALVHQRLTMLQLGLVRDPFARRVLVVARVAATCDEARICRGLQSAVQSVHSQVERSRGTEFAIAALAAPCDVPEGEVRGTIVEGAPLLPDGAAAVTWREARRWGLRPAIQNMSL